MARREEHRNIIEWAQNYEFLEPRHKRNIELLTIIPKFKDEFFELLREDMNILKNGLIMEL